MTNLILFRRIRMWRVMTYCRLLCCPDRLSYAEALISKPSTASMPLAIDSLELQLVMRWGLEVYDEGGISF